MYGGSLCAGPHNNTTDALCPDQPDPRPDPNPNPIALPLTLILTLALPLTLTPTETFAGLEVCSRGRQGQY